MTQKERRARSAEWWVRKAMVALDAASEAMLKPLNKCRGCDKDLLHGGRGRPPVWCGECKGGPKWLASKRALALKSYHDCKETRKARVALLKGAKNAKPD